MQTRLPWPAKDPEFSAPSALLSRCGEDQCLSSACLVFQASIINPLAAAEAFFFRAATLPVSSTISFPLSWKGAGSSGGWDDDSGDGGGIVWPVTRTPEAEWWTVLNSVASWTSFDGQDASHGGACAEEPSPLAGQAKWSMEISLNLKAVHINTKMQLIKATFHSKIYETHPSVLSRSINCRPSTSCWDSWIRCWALALYST